MQQSLIEVLADRETILYYRQASVTPVELEKVAGEADGPLLEVKRKTLALTRAAAILRDEIHAVRLVRSPGGQVNLGLGEDSPGPVKLHLYGAGGRLLLEAQEDCQGFDALMAILAAWFPGRGAAGEFYARPYGFEPGAVHGPDLPELLWLRPAEKPDADDAPAYLPEARPNAKLDERLSPAEAGRQFEQGFTAWPDREFGTETRAQSQFFTWDTPILELVQKRVLAPGPKTARSPAPGGETEPFASGAAQELRSICPLRFGSLVLDAGVLAAAASYDYSSPVSAFYLQCRLAGAQDRDEARRRIRQAALDWGCGCGCGESGGPVLCSGSDREPPACYAELDPLESYLTGKIEVFILHRQDGGSAEGSREAEGRRFAEKSGSAQSLNLPDKADFHRDDPELATLEQPNPDAGRPSCRIWWDEERAEMGIASRGKGLTARAPAIRRVVIRNVEPPSLGWSELDIEYLYTGKKDKIIGHSYGLFDPAAVFLAERAGLSVVVALPVE